MRTLWILVLCFPWNLFAQETVFTYFGEIEGDVREVSGVVFIQSMGFLVIGDSGNEPQINVVDYQGYLQGSITLPTLVNRDWEEMQLDVDGRLYIGDIGNNFSDRDTMVIYRINNILPHYLEGIPLEMDSIRFTYSDQLPSMPFNETGNFDCEAFVVAKDEIHLYSKDHSGQNFAKHYVLPNETGAQLAMLQDSMQLDAWVTGANLNWGANLLHLCSNNSMTTFVNADLNQPCTTYDFPTTQVEGVHQLGDGAFTFVEDVEGEGALSKMYSMRLASRDDDLALFPNPANERIQLTANQSILRFSVFDRLGKIVFEKEFETPVPDYILDVSNWAEGHYTAIIEIEGAEIPEPFVVVH